MPEGTATAADAKLDERAAVLLLLLLVTLCLHAEGALYREPGSIEPSEFVVLAGYDVVQVLLIAVWVGRSGPSRLLGLVRTRLAAQVGVAVAVLAVVSTIAHPSWRGLDLLYRAVAAVAIVDACTHLGRRRRLFLGALVAVGAFEGALGLAQSVHGGPLGLGILEFPFDPFSFGSNRPGQAGFFHPYVLAAFLLVAFGAAVVGVLSRELARPWILATFPIGLGLARTFSRAAMVALAAGVVVLLIARSKPVALRVALIAVVLAGVGIGTLTAGSGWTARSQTTLSSNADSGRIERLREAQRLASSSPLVGVGLGRYTTVLRHQAHRDPAVHSHNVVMQAAAELGYLGGALTALLLALGVWWALRAGPVVWCVLVLLAPFWLLDALTVVLPTGIVVGALWVSTLVLAADDRTLAPGRDPAAQAVPAA